MDRTKSARPFQLSFLRSLTTSATRGSYHTECWQVALKGRVFQLVFHQFGGGVVSYLASHDASVSVADFSVFLGARSLLIALAIRATYSIVPLTASSGAVASSLDT